jgi:hypothetical protein
MNAKWGMDPADCAIATLSAEKAERVAIGGPDGGGDCGLLRFGGMRGLQLAWLAADLDGLGDSQGQFLLLGLVRLVCPHNALNERVADDIGVFKVAEVDAFHAIEDVDGVY